MCGETLSKEISSLHKNRYGIVIPLHIETRRKSPSSNLQSDRSRRSMLKCRKQGRSSPTLQHSQRGAARGKWSRMDDQCHNAEQPWQDHSRYSTMQTKVKGIAPCHPRIQSVKCVLP